MGFEEKGDAPRPYVPQEGDTLDSIAERETAMGNPITAATIARFNWGTDDPEEIEAFMRDRLGCRKRNKKNRFIIAGDDTPRFPLQIPPFRPHADGETERRHVFRVRKQSSPQQFLACSHIPGVTFGFNKSFVHPSVRGYLKKLERLTRAHPKAKVMIFGHTDSVGSDLYNKKLSERRAWSVHAYIINDTAAWETLYNHGDEHWGAAEIQEILAALGHNPGPIDGQIGPQTQSAMRSFLGVDQSAPVQNDADFRRQLFAAYMTGRGDIDIPANRFTDPPFMGCAEFNPVEETEGPRQWNRRVTFFLFHPDRVPILPCQFADIAPCQKQMVQSSPRHRPSFRCSYFDSLAHTCKSDPPEQHGLRFSI